MHDRGHLAGFSKKTKSNEREVGMQIGEGMSGGHKTFAALIAQKEALKRKLEKAKASQDEHNVKKVQYHLGVTRRRIHKCADPHF